LAGEGEKTYREVGEGTNKNCDIDQYDRYFEQLFIWDDIENNWQEDTG